MDPSALLLAVELYQNAQQAEPTEPQEPPAIVLKVDGTAKSRVSDDVPLARRDSEERYRVNAVGSFRLPRGRLVVGGRYDAPFNDSEAGAGIAFARYRFNSGVQAGVSSLKTPTGWNEHLQAFKDWEVGDNGKFFVHGNLPIDSLDPSKATLNVQYTDSVGPIDFRLQAIDNLGAPRLQKLEVELSSPEVRWLGGAQVTGQYNRTGTPGGYVDNFELGVKKKFGAKRQAYQHRRMPR